VVAVAVAGTDVTRLLPRRGGVVSTRPWTLHRHGEYRVRARFVRTDTVQSSRANPTQVTVVEEK